MIRRTVLVVIALVLFKSTAFAGAAEKQESLSTIGTILLAEGVIAMNSGLAANYPREWGWSMTIVSPLCLGTESEELHPFVGFSLCLGVGQYNVQVLSKDQYSTRDVFEKNFVLMNGLLGLAYIGGQILEYFDSPEELSFSPSEDKGLLLSYSRSF
jgi:hypothetical protein